MTDDDNEVCELVSRARAGDALAVGALYDRYAARMFRFIRFRVRNAEDAEDLVQRVFLKMIEALPRYQARGIPFGAWLFRIARNALIDHERSRRTHEPLDAVADRPTIAPGPEELAIAASQLDAVRAALDELTDEQREVIAYRFFAELGPREIAVVMRRREGSVRALQFRALGALRRRLSPRFGDRRPVEVVE